MTAIQPPPALPRRPVWREPTLPAKARPRPIAPVLLAPVARSARPTTQQPAQRGRPVSRAATSPIRPPPPWTVCAMPAPPANTPVATTRPAASRKEPAPPARFKQHPAQRHRPQFAMPAFLETTALAGPAHRRPARPTHGITTAARPHHAWSRHPACQEPGSAPKVVRLPIGSAPRATADSSAPRSMRPRAPRGRPVWPAPLSAIRLPQPPIACARPAPAASIRAEPISRPAKIRVAARPAPCRPRRAPRPAPRFARHAWRVSSARVELARRPPAPPAPGTTTATQPPLAPL